MILHVPRGVDRIIVDHLVPHVSYFSSHLRLDHLYYRRYSPLYLDGRCGRNHLLSSQVSNPRQVASVFPINFFCTSKRPSLWASSTRGQLFLSGRQDNRYVFRCTLKVWVRSHDQIQHGLTLLYLFNRPATRGFKLSTGRTMRDLQTETVSAISSETTAQPSKRAYPTAAYLQQAQTSIQSLPSRQYPV